MIYKVVANIFIGPLHKSYMQKIKSVRPFSKVIMTLGLLMMASVFVFWFFHGFQDLDLLSVFVYAQWADEWLSDLMLTILDGLQAIMQIIYILLWPLMFISGIALDNSLVYGEFINLDSILWSMWNVSKNLANFALGFFVLFEIIKFVFLAQDSDLWGVFKVLQWALIAGIGIQASWFIMWVLIDVSTILIVSLGWLPLSLISNMDIGNEPILGVQWYINLSDTNSANSDKVDAVVYYKRDKHIFPMCRVTKNYIVGWIYDNTINNELDFTQNADGKVYCAWNSTKLVDITVLKNNKVWGNPVTAETVAASVTKLVEYYDIKSITTGLNTVQQALKTEMDADEDKHKANIQGIVNLIPGRDIKFEDWVEIFDIEDNWLNWKTDFTDAKKRGVGTFLWDLMQSSKWFVGPMVTLYVTLLEFSSLHTTSVAWGEAGTGMGFFFEFMLKAIVGLMLVIPLIILAIVLLMRIGILRVVIAFSPLLALLRGFGKWEWTSKINSNLSMKNIIWLIFAPVIPVFVLWIAILFLQTLSNQFLNPSNQWERKSFGIDIVQYADEQISCASIRWAMEFCYESQWEETWTSIYANLFSWLLVNIFAIWLVWTLITLSFRWNDITQWVVNTVTKTATSIAGNIPFIPIPWAWAWGSVGYVWSKWFSEITWLWSWWSWTITNKIRRVSELATAEKVKNFENFLDWTPTPGTPAATAASTAAANDILTKQNATYRNINLSTLQPNEKNIIMDWFIWVVDSSLAKIKKGDATKTELDSFIEELNGTTWKEYAKSKKELTDWFDVTTKDWSTIANYKVEYDATIWIFTKTLK